MEEDVLKLKRKLLDAVDRNHNVCDAGAITEVLEVLENIEIDEELLRSTRLGKIVNDLRRNLKDEALARRAKQLVKRWRSYIVLRAGGTIARITQVSKGGTDSAENYVDGDSSAGKKTSPEWVADGKLEARNYDSRISKEHCGRLGTSVTATRSSSVQEQEPAAEVFDNKMQNGSLNRFVEGKCKNLASTIRATKEMVTTMNPQDWDAKKLNCMTDIDKSCFEQKVHRGQKIKMKAQLLDSAKTAQASANFTPRKKVKTTQELIKTVLNNSDLPQDGARNLHDLGVASRTSQGEHIKRTKLEPKGPYMPSSTPLTEDRLAPLEDCKNERTIVGHLAECVSTAAQSTVNHEVTVMEKVEVPGKIEDACQGETVKKIQCETIVPAHELNVTHSSIVECEEADTVSDYEDADCSASFEKIEGVTGIFDEGPRKNRADDGFREWHQCLSKRSYKGEFLAILPYVVID